MKRLFYSIIIGALVSTLAIGAEVRKLGEYDLSWGPFGTTWTSPAGKVVRYLPRYFDNNAFADNLALHGKSLTGDGSGSITGFNIPLYVSQYLSVLDAVTARKDIRYYGADPTGVIDSTTAIQTAFDELDNGHTLLFPSGTYKISAGLTLQNKSGWKIEGTGTAGNAVGATIYWDGDGDNTATLLDLAGSTNSSIENIMFLGTSHWGLVSYSDTFLNRKAASYKTKIGAYIRYGDRNSTAITFKNCAWHFFGTGIQVGHLTVNEDNNENNIFQNVEFSYNTIGYRQHWPNSMNNQFYGAIFSFNNTDLYFGDGTLQTGSTMINGFSSSYADTNIYINNPVYQLSFINSRTELAKKFIDSNQSTATSLAPSISIINALIYTDNTYTGSPFIKLAGNNITAINSQFGSNPSIGPVINWVFPLNDTTVTFINCDFYGDYVMLWGDNTTTFPGRTRINLIGSRYYSNASFHLLSDRSYWSQNSSANIPSGYGFTDNSVTRYNVYNTDWIFDSSSGSQITGLDNGYLGQKVTIVCNGSTNMVNSSELQLNGTTDFLCDSNSTLTLINARYFWAEIGRSTR